MLGVSTPNILMKPLIYVMAPVLILALFLASRFVTWEQLKGTDKQALKHLNTGTQFLKTGDMHQAIAALTQAIEIDPKYASAYMKRGIAYYHLSQYDSAIADYNQTLALKRYFADAHASRGDVYRALGNVSQALADYTASLKKRWSAGVLLKRAEIYLELNKIDRAMADYQQLIKRRPTAAVYYARGKAYYQLSIAAQPKTEHLTNALADFDETIRLEPRSAFAYFWRAVVNQKLERFDNARSDMKKLNQLLYQFLLEKIKNF